MGVPPPALLGGRAHWRWYRLGRPRLHYARGRFLHAEGGRLGSVLPGAGGAAVLGRLLVPGYRPLRTSPDLSLVCSHWSGGARRAGRLLLAQKLPPFGWGSGC